MDNASPAVETESNNVTVTVNELIIPEKTVVTHGEAMLRIHDIGVIMRELIVDIKKLPTTGAYQAHQDPGRSLSLAQSHLQTGMMWLKRAVTPSEDF